MSTLTTCACASISHSHFVPLLTHVVVVEEGILALLYLVELTLSETATMVRHARNLYVGRILLLALAKLSRPLAVENFTSRGVFHSSAVREGRQE